MRTMSIAIQALGIETKKEQQKLSCFLNCLLNYFVIMRYCPTNKARQPLQGEGYIWAVNPDQLPPGALAT